MQLSFLTPLGALLAAAALVPLAVFAARQRRGRRIRKALGLAHPSLASRVPLVLALAAVPGLLGLAAAQPIVESDRVRSERTDAEAFVVLDISRSMLASTGPDAPTRYERARELVLRLSGELPEVPLGLASLTDRVLPHVFPTADRRVVETALVKTMGIEQPPPALTLTGHVTRFDALAVIPARNYFSRTARRRLLVVLTDGETLPLERDLAAAFRREPRIETIFVRFWDATERIYEAGVPEDAYRPVQASGAALARAASAIGGRVLPEDDPEAVAAAARAALGTGPTRERVIEGERRALMPWVALAAVLPLGFVLLRRNL